MYGDLILYTLESINVCKKVIQKHIGGATQRQHQRLDALSDQVKDITDEIAWGIPRGRELKMSYMKQWLEEISMQMGHEGEINDAVIEEAKKQLENKDA